MGKYLARGHGVPYDQFGDNFLKVLTRKAVRFCSQGVVRLFPDLLAQMRTALIRIGAYMAHCFNLLTENNHLFPPPPPGK